MKYHVCNVRWTLRLTLLKSWKQAPTQWISLLSQTMWDMLRKLPLSPKILVSAMTVSPLILNTLNLENGLSLLWVRNTPLPISWIPGYVKLSSQKYNAWPDCVDMRAVLTLYWWEKNKYSLIVTGAFIIQNVIMLCAWNGTSQHLSSCPCGSSIIPGLVDYWWVYASRIAHDYDFQQLS